jgi:cytidylate kinase
VTRVAEADNNVDRELARMASNGRARIDVLLDDHCEAWCFSRTDRQLILSVVLPIYEEARKFLDL